MQEDKSQERQFEFRNEENQKVEKGENDERIQEYDSNEYISRAKRVQNGTVPMNILEFHHSFSYDCQRYFNLCVAEPNIIIFISGNILHFWNSSTNKLWFRRGYTGAGIGHVTKNPMFDHIAVAENGIKPPIIIYKWPSMDIVTILYNGTLKSYSHLAYSADGLLLVSQGGDPDYTITLWNWQKSKIALKCKSYNRDVYNITISSSLPGYLVTSGSGHIKFWKISETFTGLKLKGEIGRFGQTEISDIIGVYIMPDGKVVSGCEWGNILLWEEGLITLEICKKNREPCHTKAITQFEYINGELISVGMDGWIRIWFYETIDQADSDTEERFLEIQPIYEYHVNEVNNSMLMCICKQEPDNPENMFWYAQDGNGGIWLIDLHTPKVELSQKIFTCHAGAIADMDCATWGPFIVTLGKAGQLHIYNYIEKRLILVYNFNDIGSQIIWFPCQIEATGSTFACAFESGVIRIIVVAISKANAINDIRGDYVRLIQVVKPHKMAITVMSLNPSCSLLVTGSEDSTVFSFTIMTNTYPVITPIGFIKVPSGVTCLTWKPQCETTILIGCSQGDCVEVTLPSTPQSYTIASYELVQCRSKAFKFYSVKSAIRNELLRLIREKEKEEKIAKKREEIARLIAESPEMEINEEAFLINMEEEPLPEIYIPKVPNKILIAQYISQYIIWLLMAGFDAGYIYEYPSPEVSETIVEKPVKSIMIHDADDIEIRSCLFYKKKKYLFLGMEHGQIRVCKLKPENYTDLSDYWILSMHDNFNGYIPKIIVNHNQKMLFTCGYDGNLFSYEINDDTPPEAIEFEIIKGTLSLPYISIEDIEDIDHASLEEMIQQAEHDRIATMAKQSKHHTLQMLSKLSEEYSNIIERNNELPKSHRIARKELELDPRIIADLDKELEAEMIIVHEKLAFKIEKSQLGLQKLFEYFIQPITHLPFAIYKISKPDNLVYSLRQHILNIDVTLPHINAIKHVHAYKTPFNTGINGNSVMDDKAQNYEEKQREEGKTEEETSTTQEQSVALFLKDIDYKDTDSSLGIQLNQMLNKYNLRKTRLEQREKEWKIIYNEKPDKSINHMYDIFAIEEARKTIGDYKLKTSSTFNLLSEERDTLFSKYKQLLKCQKKIQTITDKVDVKMKEITKLRNQIKNMLLEYMNRINDNKFRNFLCRIFKKKYKESKEEDETTTTTTETTSDETNSIDTRESELDYFDENICPPGCDKKLYDLAFSMREKRYSCEHQIKDAQQIIEILQKEIQIQTKKLKVIESNLKKNEEDLNMFMLEKQKKLNNVDVTIIIKLHQLQYFEKPEIPLKLHDCVLFNKNRLSKLYVRIQELHEETLELHVKHKRARMHLQRIKVDCNHMRVNNNNLKNEIKLKIINKFGQNISLNKLYETILRRMVYDIKANLNDTTMYFTKRIKHVKESYAEELVILNKLIREHTQKLSFLTILVEEQSKLQKLSKRHIMSDEEMLQLEEKYKSDIVKLEKILENQTRQKYLFQNDIKNLKLKIKSQSD
ncbi:cilia- and flagella-associated protein 44 isoform X5 [Cataglyphis hispanica]|uniref:cilia- and flagella-associated protein 44 isoform X5 n=1 Tax=Cataglyphis hispanica TaxID=1086592 RepID=UPI00217F5122|nr:cilia- and flagella-associated protein 44 isoform X5 [Cataglyphis hispanica]